MRAPREHVHAQEAVGWISSAKRCECNYPHERPLVRLGARHHHGGNGENYECSGTRGCASQLHTARLMQ
jgi:hypothetical protein